MINIFCPAQSLQGAIDRAQPGDTIKVSGACGENVVVRDDKQRVVIDGGSVASVNGSKNFVPVFDVTGKEISIRNFASIRGGSVGIHVHLNSTAGLHNNVIQQVMGVGIRIDERSSAIITSNVVSNNETGIEVMNNSDARIGADGDSKQTGANIVTNNTFGVTINHQSHALIKGNTISNNMFGVGIIETSRAEIESNNIQANSVVAIEVMNRSEAAIFYNSGSSDGVGVHCTYGGRVVGGLHRLTGKMFPKMVELDCVDELSLEEK